MLNLANAVLELKKEGDQAQRRLRELDAALKVLDSLGGSRGTLARSHVRQEAEDNISGGSQTDRGGPARTLGEVESGQA